MEEEFTIVFIAGESDGQVIKTENRPNRQPKTAKRQIYEFLLEVTDSKTFFYFFSEEINQEKVMEKANAWMSRK